MSVSQKHEIKRLRGKHKLEDKWEADVHVVVSRAGDFPVYTVCQETKRGPLRTLYRDLLLPCGFLPIGTPEKRTPPPVVKRPRTRQNPGSENERNEYEQLDDDEHYPLRFVTVESATFDIMPEVDPTTDDIVSEHDTAEHTLPLPEPCTTETEVWAPLEVEEEALTTNSTCHDHDNPEMLGGNLTDRSDSSRRCDTSCAF